jgi:hypothetical protein
MNQTNRPISPSDYKAAVYSIERIAPVLATLQKLDSQTLHRDADAVNKVANFTEFLCRIHDLAQAVINQGNEQYENHPIELIGKAASRLNQIPRDIELVEKTLHRASMRIRQKSMNWLKNASHRAKLTQSSHLSVKTNRQFERKNSQPEGRI